MLSDDEPTDTGYRHTVAMTGDGTPHLDAETASVVLSTLEKFADRAIAVVRPVVADGVMVDGTIVWLSDTAHRMDPRAVRGATLLEVYGATLGHQDTGQAAQLALRKEGSPVVWGPFPVDFSSGRVYLEVSVTWLNGLLFVEYVDRTAEFAKRQVAQQADHNFRELLEGLDAGVVLLRPSLTDDGRVFDAEIEWSNRTSAELWTNKEGLAAGTKVASVYYDLNDWLDAANSAWQGRPFTRILHADPDVAVWTAATETLRRVGDLLVEVTTDRSDDQMLLNRLDELDHRFRSLVDDLPLTVLVGSLASDTFDFVSPNASELTGHALVDLQRLADWNELIHPDDVHLLRAFGSATAAGGTHETNLRLIRADGSLLTVTLRGTRRTIDDGPEGFVLLVSDFTEQQLMIDRIAAGDRLETLGRTAGSIAHDFNNLLMIVAGNLERAQRQFGHESLTLNTAHAATKRAAELAGSLLGFARGRPGSPSWVDPAELIRQFEPIMHGVLFPNAQLRIEVEPDLPVVWVDRAHIEQMLLNLITNARDATDQRGHVTLRVGRTDGAHCHLLDSPSNGPHLGFAITDDGSGITPELLAKVFEPFFTSKAPTQNSGTGLGLSTVHGLAHQHGGHVHIDSTVGVGTTVTVYLPLPSTR
jgi:PAS domain S-box-containing protein